MYILDPIAWSWQGYGSEKGDFGLLSDWLRFQLKIAKNWHFWVDEVKSLEFILSLFQNVEWDASSARPTFRLNSTFRSRSLVVKCMGRYTVFLGTFKALLRAFRQFGDFENHQLGEGHFWQNGQRETIWPKRQFGDFGQFKLLARSKAAQGLWPNFFEIWLFTFPESGTGFWPKAPILAIFGHFKGTRLRISQVLGFWPWHACGTENRRFWKPPIFGVIEVGMSGGACGRRQPVNFGARSPILQNRRPQNRRGRKNRLRRCSVSFDKLRLSTTDWRRFWGSAAAL